MRSTDVYFPVQLSEAMQLVGPTRTGCMSSPYRKLDGYRNYSKKNLEPPPPLSAPRIDGCFRDLKVVCQVSFSNFPSPHVAKHSGEHGFVHLLMKQVERSFKFAAKAEFPMKEVATERFLVA
jgi:hypothetical protein